MKKLFNILFVVGLFITSVGQTKAMTPQRWTEELSFLLVEAQAPTTRWDVQTPSEHIVPIARQFKNVTFSWADLSVEEFNQLMTHMPVFIKKARNTLRLSGFGDHVKNAANEMLSLGEGMLDMASNFRNCDDAKAVGYLLGFIGRIGLEFAAGKSDVTARSHVLMNNGLGIINDCNKKNKMSKLPVQAVAAIDIDFKNFDAVFQPVVAEAMSRGSTPDYRTDDTDSSDEVSTTTHKFFNPAEQLKKREASTRGTHQTFNPAEQFMREDRRNNQTFNPFQNADFKPEDYQ